MFKEILGLLLVIVAVVIMLAQPKPKKNALLIIDVQNDFCPPSGSLAVAGGDQIIRLVNRVRAEHKWDLVALTQDWHPQNHCSFSINNPGSTLFQPFKLPSGEMQMMWPAHCVQNSKGAEFHPDLVIDKNDAIVKKGMNVNVDSYSGFFDNDHKTKSDLEDILKKAGVTDVYLVGLAYDYCVGYSALDAKAAGFNVFVLEDATRAVADASKAERIAEMQKAGVSIINSSAINFSGKPKSQ